MTWLMQKIMGQTIRKSSTANIFLPQHRERIVLVGFRRDLNLKADFYPCVISANVSLRSE